MLKSCSDELTRIAITVGDPEGIGPEIIAKALSSHHLRPRLCAVVVGDQDAMEHAITRWGDFPARRVSAPDYCSLSDAFVQLWNPSTELICSEHLPPEMRWVQAAAEGCMAGKFAAMVTAPVCKESLYSRGFRFPGHTEFLAHVTGARNTVMAFVAPKLKVSLATIHLPLSAVSRTISSIMILETLRVSSQGLKEFFCIPNPRIAVCGVNPHAGENGHLGDEESSIILPAVRQALAEGMSVNGPLSADTVFGKAVRGEFDLVVAMYHDQGLIPVKLLGFGESVNVSLGLPVVRTSVDHGVAYDIAGQGVADAASMEAAIELALTIVANRTRNRFSSQD